MAQMAVLVNSDYVEIGLDVLPWQFQEGEVLGLDTNFYSILYGSNDKELGINANPLQTLEG